MSRLLGNALSTEAIESILRSCNDEIGLVRGDVLQSRLDSVQIRLRRELENWPENVRMMTDDNGGPTRVRIRAIPFVPLHMWSLRNSRLREEGRNVYRWGGYQILSFATVCVRASTPKSTRQSVAIIETTTDDHRLPLRLLLQEIRATKPDALSSRNGMLCHVSL